MFIYYFFGLSVYDVTKSKIIYILKGDKKMAIISFGDDDEKVSVDKELTEAEKMRA